MALPEHDWLEPLPALAVGQALAKGACVAGNHGLTKLVAVVTGTIGGVNQNLITHRNTQTHGRQLVTNSQHDKC